jgi:YD repeat-containing protein
LLVPDGRKLDIFEVSLWWGAFFAIKTDLYVPDTIPLAFTRTSTSDYFSGQYHNYLRHVYEPFLTGDRNPYTYLRCFFADGTNLTYQRVSPGTGFVDAVYEDASPFPLFQGSRFAWNGWGWDLALPDGMTYLFPEAYNATRLQQGSLAGVFDGNGNEVRLTRQENGDLTEITSPNGSRINFSYAQGLMSRAADSLGNSVDYAYDERHRLGKVTDSHGEATEYEYNVFSHIVRVLASNGSVILENTCSPHDRDNKVVQLSLQGGETYSIQYAFAKQGGRGHVDVTNPSGEVTRVNLEPEPDNGKSYYNLEKLSHAGTRK